MLAFHCSLSQGILSIVIFILQAETCVCYFPALWTSCAVPQSLAVSLSQPTDSEAGQQVALQSAQLPEACYYSQSCPKRAGQSLRYLLSSLGLFPAQYEPWLGCCCGGDAERMMKPHKNISILLLERVGKA